MKLPAYFMVFDVESIGLHGEGFAFGYVVISQHGRTVDCGRAACSPNKARGTADSHLWVAENVPPLDDTHDSPRWLREAFWSVWRHWSERGAVLVADVAWPVEARFLAACVDDNPQQRGWEGPYPLHELTSIALALGEYPLHEEWVARLPDELPAHDPLADARHSARILAQLLATRAAT